MILPPVSDKFISGLTEVFTNLVFQNFYHSSPHIQKKKGVGGSVGFKPSRSLSTVELLSNAPQQTAEITLDESNLRPLLGNLSNKAVKMSVNKFLKIYDHVAWQMK